MPIEIIAEPAPRGDGRFDSDEYVSSVRRTLAVIRGSRVGEAVMRHLWKRLEIRPWTGGGRNASALPLQRPNAPERIPRFIVLARAQSEVRGRDLAHAARGK